MKLNYDIVISFSGSDRAVARDIAGQLQTHGVRVFYDEFDQAFLWGKNLYDELADIYANRARFCLMLISASYAKKKWTSHERKHAQERALRANTEYILPVRLDDTEIPGLPDTVAYFDLRQSSVTELVESIETKLGRRTRRQIVLGSDELSDDLPIALGSSRKEVHNILKEPDIVDVAFDTFFAYGLVVNYEEDVVSRIHASTLTSGTTFFGRVLGVRIGDDLQHCIRLWGEPNSIEPWPFSYDVYEWLVETYKLMLEMWTKAGIQAKFGPYKPGRVKNISIEKA